MAVGVILLLFACFLSATIHVLWERRTVTPVPVSRVVASPPASRPRRTLQLGTVTCEVVEFEDFELIKTMEHVLPTVEC
jgi:hypothetical protein